MAENFLVFVLTHFYIRSEFIKTPWCLFLGVIIEL